MHAWHLTTKQPPIYLPEEHIVSLFCLEDKQQVFFSVCVQYVF